MTCNVKVERSDWKGEHTREEGGERRGGGDGEEGRREEKQLKQNV